MRHALCLLALLASLATESAADLRLGIVGTDTSHATDWTEILNDAHSPEHVTGARVVAAYKGGSPDVEASRTRVDKFAAELAQKWGVEFEPDIPTLCLKVDAVLLLSVDGRVHLAQARQIIAAHKPVFIDKPLAATLDDVREIDRLAKAAGVPWFSSSSLRYGEIATTMKFADTQGAMTWGPGPTEPHHQLELAWYAIHPIELLFTLMGPGCEEASWFYSENSDALSCRWHDGRLGTVRTLRPYGGYGAVVFRPNEQFVESPAKPKESYGGLVAQIVRFFQTGRPPVPNAETIEIYSFMDAAERSKQAGGRAMQLR